MSERFKDAIHYILKERNSLRLENQDLKEQIKSEIYEGFTKEYNSKPKIDKLTLENKKLRTEKKTLKEQIEELKEKINELEKGKK